MRVLGIDPGTAALGYGIVEGTAAQLRAVDFGCFETVPDDGLPARLLTIHRFLGGLFALHRPDLVAIERLFFSKNAQTAIAVGQARGVVLLAAAEAAVPVREATPSEIKAAVAGHGAAGKAEMARMVQVSLGLSSPPTPDDAADALAAAVWAATRERAGASSERSAVLDRAAAAPIERGESPFDRAVREALAAEAAEARSGSR